MIATVKQAFDRLETGRAQLYKNVAGRSETAQTQPTRPGEWSPVQTIAHLAIADEILVGYIGSAAGRKPTRSPMLPMMLFVLNRRIRVPAPDAMLPPDNCNLDEAAARWGAARERLQAALDTVDDGEKTVFAVHPVLGPLSASQLLSVMAAHQTYHHKGLF